MTFALGDRVRIAHPKEHHMKLIDKVGTIRKAYHGDWLVSLQENHLTNCRDERFSESELEVA